MEQTSAVRAKPVVEHRAVDDVFKATVRKLDECKFTGKADEGDVRILSQASAPIPLLKRLRVSCTGTATAREASEASRRAPKQSECLHKKNGQTRKSHQVSLGASDMDG